MGTSKNYKASIKGEPQWGDLSREVTRACDGSELSPKVAQAILSNYFKVNTGNSSKVIDINNHRGARSSTSGGGGGGRAIGAAGRKTARKLSGFFYAVSTSSLSQAFSEIGIDLSGKTVQEAIYYLLDYCAGVANNLDETAAKAAVNQLIDLYTEGAETLEDMEEKLKATIDSEGIDNIVVNYFAFYTFEHLHQMFVGKLLKEKGRPSCSTFFKNIKEFIIECLKGINSNTPLRNINWKGTEVQTIIDDIYTKTINYFRFYED